MEAFALALLFTLTALAENDGKLTIEIPASVQATIAKERGDAGQVTEFKKVNEIDGTTYVIGILFEGKKYVLSLDAAGRVMRKQIEEEDSGPKQMGIDAVPAKVRQTLKREAGAASIGDIEAQEARTIYVTEVVVGTRRYRLEVDADGVLRSKEYVGNQESE